ncbi:MAG TPA: helix-turn-helix transcriptional regulator [Verrucomicrobiae bacterium]|jgi:transcriptional regulator with XRE-family HTH domain|nr:helix-turn-helix transcriptional regulator [Verrucomicrobiae bacterium]
MPVRKPKRCPRRIRFGKNVALLRRRRNLTQEKLAERIGTSPRYIQSIEAGEYFPSLPTLARLKIALRSKWDDMLGGCEKV